MKLVQALAAAAALTVWALPLQAAPDERVLAAARAAEPALVASLREMVSIESGTTDRAGLNRMADYAEQRLKALGLSVQRRPTSAGNSDLLVAQAKGSGRRRLMLIAHMDTVYPTGILASQPLRDRKSVV